MDLHQGCLKDQRCLSKCAIQGKRHLGNNMIEIHFRDHECDAARLYSQVAALHSHLMEAIHAMPGASQTECEAHLETALRIVDELTQLRGSDIPLADVDDFVHQTRLALQALAQERSKSTENTDETSKGLWDSVSAVSNSANRLCDCLVGFTKDCEKLLHQRITEQHQEMTAKHAKVKKSSLFSRLMFWKRSED